MTAATAAEFLIDVLAHPKDDTPRLVCADWLDEYGGERGRKQADLIRLQVRLARTRHDHCYRLCGRVTFRRGFVEEFRGPCRVWLEHGSDLVRGHPLTLVGLTDREPRDALRPGEWWWWEEDEAHPVPPMRCDLPTVLWELLPGDRPLGWRGIRYHSRAAAVNALSVACLDFACQPSDDHALPHSVERQY
jgi:uncharacterized protein (TIGR02996 family)